VASIERLLEIMATLRDPETGCPWDVAQDFASIAPYTIEEAYEVDDAIRRGDLEDLRDELGDLLLQVVFHARMAEEAGRFAFGDVVDAICEKMIRRHPHVFGDAEIADAEAQILNWEAIKSRERAIKSRERAIKSRERDARDEPVHPLDDVPATLPALTRAAKLHRRARRAGLPSAAPAGDGLGERLFALVVEANRAGLDPERALLDVAERFRATARRKDRT